LARREKRSKTRNNSPAFIQGKSFSLSKKVPDPSVYLLTKTEEKGWKRENKSIFPN
jgi:hypothetical protein